MRRQRRHCPSSARTARADSLSARTESRYPLMSKNRPSMGSCEPSTRCPSRRCMPTRAYHHTSRCNRRLFPHRRRNRPHGLLPPLRYRRLRSQPAGVSCSLNCSCTCHFRPIARRFRFHHIRLWRGRIRLPRRPTRGRRLRMKLSQSRFWHILMRIPWYHRRTRSSSTIRRHCGTSCPDRPFRRRTRR